MKALGWAAAKSAIVEREVAKWKARRSTLSWHDRHGLVREADARKARRAFKAAIAMSADPASQAPRSKRVGATSRPGQRLC